ncbi:MAG: SufS family cysteine desulfurase [Candidatus Micrarchaeia archaeon]
MFDAERARADFPIFSGSEMVYLDSAATSQKPRQVIDAISGFYSKRNSNISRGLYTLAEEATMEYESVRSKTKGFINAAAETEVIFTKSATESLNLVMRGWGERFIGKGDRIVTTALEHHSNFVPWQALAAKKKAGFEVAGIDGEGKLDLTDLEKKLAGAKLLAVSAASNVTGAVSDIRRICAMAHDEGAVCVVDGAQSVPSYPTDVRKLGCDFLAFSGHKMLAPFGVGVLYGKEELLESMDPFLYGSEMIRSVSERSSEWNTLPYRFEPGTPDVAAVIGLGPAIDYLVASGLDNIRAHEERLVRHMLDSLPRVEGLTVIGPEDARGRGPLVAFTMDKAHPHDVAAMLAEDGICVRSGHHCAMPVHERLGIQASTRASVYLYNKKDEIDALVDSLGRIEKIFS